MLRTTRIILKLLILTVLLNGAAVCFYSYAIVPGKYTKESYQGVEVQKIAYTERQEGVQFAYELNESNLMYVYIPLLVLLLAHFVVEALEWRERRKNA